MASPCPPPKVLDRYRMGRLNPRSRVHVAGHLKVCPACAENLQAESAPAPRAPPTAPRSGSESTDPSLRQQVGSPDEAPTIVHDSGRLGPVSSASSSSPRLRVSRPASHSGSGMSYAAVSMDEISISSNRWAATEHSMSPAVAGDTDQLSLPRGTPLGRYIILDPLGAGGLGVVYAAYDPELDRRVAIKLLRPGAGSVGDGANGERLLREGQAMARLSHPNVVAVHDVGRVGTEIFVAMELVDGLPLSQWMKAGGHDWKEIRDVFLQAGQGLAAAHAAGLVHRDFKPGNVLVTLDEDGKAIRAQVLDFGLARGKVQVAGQARNLESLSSGEYKLLESELTEAGVIMGTPQYMAPEQFKGADVTPAADQFSFCITLWQALYGERPFVTDNLFALPKIVEAGQIQEPADRRGTPQWLHRLLKRGLSARPEERFPSMNALLHALQRDRRSRRRQWMGLVAAAVLSAGSATAAAAFVRPEPTQQEASEIDTLAEAARAAAAKSYFVYPPVDDPAGATAYRKVLELESLETQLADEMAADLRTEFAQTLVRLGDQFYEREGGRPFAADYYAAALVFEPGNEHARARTTLTPGEVAALREKADEADFTQAELVAAESLAALAEDDETKRLERLEALYARADGPSPSTAARVESLLSPKERKRLARRAAPKPKGMPKQPAPLEVIEPPAEDPAEAPEEVVELDEVDEGPAPAVADTNHNPSKAKELAAEGMKALRAFQVGRAEQLFHRALGYDRRNVKALAGLAELYFEQGSYPKAVQFAKQAVQRSPRSGRYRLLLGDAYYKTLAYESARREYEKAKGLGNGKADARLRQLESRVGG